MAEIQKPSCMKRALWGCGCVAAGSALLLGALALMAFLSRPGEPDILPLDMERRVGSSETRTLELGGDPGPDKPVRVKLDINQAEFNIAPDAEDGQFRVDGRYDQANYKLKTDMSDKGDFLEYVVSLEYKRGFRMSFTDEEMRNNNLTLHVPRNLPVDLDAKIRMGAGDLDLTGVPLRSFKGDFSLGAFKVRKRWENPEPMERFDVALSMGETEVQDLQNFRAAKIKASASMSELSLNNSGAYPGDVAFDLKASMGAIKIMIHEDNRIKSNIDKYWGGDVEGPTDKQEPALGPLVTLNGLSRAGGVLIMVGAYKKMFTEVMGQIIEDQDVDAAIAAFRTFRQEKSEEFRHSPSALRGLGYKLLESGHTEDALAIFKLNAEEYADNKRSFRALAAAHRDLEQYEEALRNLDIALDKDPAYDSALSMKREIEALIKERDGQ